MPIRILNQGVEVDLPIVLNNETEAIDEIMDAVYDSVNNPDFDPQSLNDFRIQEG